MENKQRVLVLDFGGQYNLLIARRVRECGIYCEILPHSIGLAGVKDFAPDAIIFTGGPATVFADGAPMVDAGIFELGVPILGICYGQQLMIHLLGGTCRSAQSREYGKILLTHNKRSALFTSIPESSICWMSHGVEVEALGEGFEVVATTEGCPFAGIENKSRRLYGVQFHPEVLHTQYGRQVLENFLYDISGLSKSWSMGSYMQEAIADCQNTIKDGKVLLGLSGGVDSSVAAALLHRAVGDNLVCIYVDHGLMRKNESAEVMEAMGALGVKVIKADAAEQFLSKLDGVSDPERKRKIIGEEFIRVFEQEAKKIGTVDFLVQGTIYPDVVESGVGEAAVIKSHHNVGGLPDHVDFKEIVEPLRKLFKDEVRALGVELGLPETLVWRQPFPGPGLAIRIMGDITHEKLEILRESDAIFREEIALANLDRTINQYFTVLTNTRTVGVMGDERTYDYTLALRAVETADFMTANWSRIPFDVLEKVSNRIVNEVPHINRIVYDITTKPPATVEWE